MKLNLSRSKQRKSQKPGDSTTKVPKGKHQIKMDHVKRELLDLIELSLVSLNLVCQVDLGTGQGKTNAST